MPYWVHKQGAEPTTGTAYADRASAVADKEDGETITFVANEYEKQHWRDREARRLTLGEYMNVPWWAESWYDGIRRLHYAHLSTTAPELVAYTPDDEYGASDRQLKIRPGKYLTKFFGGSLSKEAIDDYCAQVKAVDNELRLATNPDEIEQIYLHGPNSCMSKQFPSTHPTRVYGDSDLAVAYLGKIDHVRARSVVWPERKIYTTIYGDSTLRYLLLQHRYSEGSIEGARVRAIKAKNRYVMPYVDGAESADRDGRYFVLRNDDGGHYNVRQTSGYADEGSLCAHCDNPCEADETYCASCLEDLNYCERCNAESFDNDFTYIENYGNVCDSCADAMRSECAIDGCDSTWFEEEISPTNRADRQRRNVINLCLDCADRYFYCADCDDYFLNSTDCACQSETEVPRCESV